MRKQDQRYDDGIPQGLYDGPFPDLQSGLQTAIGFLRQVDALRNGLGQLS